MRFSRPQGSTLENELTNFYVLHQDTRELSELVSLAFLGLSINLPGVTSSPDVWMNDEYFDLVDMMARVRVKDAPGEGNFIVFAAREGDLVQPLPAGLKRLALWMVNGYRSTRPTIAASPWRNGSPRRKSYFARAIANRIWANIWEWVSSNPWMIFG